LQLDDVTHHLLSFLGLDEHLKQSPIVICHQGWQWWTTML
jgi:hypothetical protein